MEETKDHDRLQRAFTSLTQLRFAEESLDGAMRRIAELAVAVIPACDTCSVSQVDDTRTLTRVATDDVSELLDNFQYDSGEGPCMEAIQTSSHFKIDSAADEQRWPKFTRSAVEAGLHSSYSLPLRVDGRVVGALNLYSLAGPFLANDEQVSNDFAQQAAITLANADAYERSRNLVANLRIALESRDVIGQAKGIIMERERVTAERAFEVLRSVSQSRNVKLRDLAQQVVDTGTWTDETT
jgi:GAF domain-containing protein